MRISELFELVGWLFWFPALIMVVTGYINFKTYAKCYCTTEFMWFMRDLFDFNPPLAVTDAIFCCFGYWLWKHSPDDEDKQKRKRAALRSKFDKVIPKPTTPPPLMNPT